MILFRTKDNKHIFKPEKWQEFFKITIAAVYVRNMTKGSPMPPFYLPVRKPADRYVFELWILPLAPFVWLYYLITTLLWKTWEDMQTALDMLIVFTRKYNS